MARRVRFGVLVPSSNTALEPVTISILSRIPNVTVHFARFSVTTISLGSEASAQFDFSHILTAAQLLADAKVDVIGWSGTSGGWLGFDRDEQLCQRIEELTGIKATTSTLALNKALSGLRIGKGSKLGLVTPYTSDVQEAIINNYKGIGIEINQSIERHLNIKDNHEIAAIPDEKMWSAVQEVAKEGVSVVTTFCTNLRTASLVDAMESDFGVTVIDSVAVVVWDMLRLVGMNPLQITGWGKLFELP